MMSIGIRQLRQRASEFLRRVAAGETIEVTDRGRPVALLTPVPDGEPLAMLLAAGEIEAAVSPIDDLPDPLELPPGVDPPSVVLSRLRTDER